MNMARMIALCFAAALARMTSPSPLPAPAICYDGTAFAEQRQGVHLVAAFNARERRSAVCSLGNSWAVIMTDAGNCGSDRDCGALVPHEALHVALGGCAADNNCG